MAAGKISRSTRNRIDSILEQLDHIATNAGRLTEDSITELIKRASISSAVDGFGPGGSLDGGSRGNSSSDGISRPTESAALQEPRLDPVKAEAKRIQNWIWEADRDLADAVQSMKYINLKVEEEYGKPIESSPCLTCPAAAEKRGMCNSCYTDWYRHGRPDQPRWVLFKTQARNSDNPPAVLVLECPPPSTGNSATRGPWKS